MSIVNPTPVNLANIAKIAVDGDVCLQTLPCVHDCTIRTLDGREISSRLDASEIIAFSNTIPEKVDFGGCDQSHLEEQVKSLYKDHKASILSDACHKELLGWLIPWLLSNEAPLPENRAARLAQRVKATRTRVPK